MAPKHEQIWEYTGMRKHYVFQEAPILMKVLVIQLKNDNLNSNLFSNQMLFLIDEAVMDSSK